MVKWSERTTGILVRVLACFGIFQLYNIVSFYQDVVALSQSFKIISGWWHYGVRSAFEAVHIHLELWQRESLVLLTFAVSVANLRFYQEHGLWLTGQVLRSASDPNNSKIGPKLFENEKVAGAFHPVTLLMSGLLSVLLLLQWVKEKDASRPLPFPGPAYYVLGTLCLIVVFLWRFSGVRRKLGDAVAFVLIFIPFYLALWLFALYRYRVSILKSTGLILLLLAADLAFRYAIDPIIKVWPEIPPPPA